MQMDAAGKLAGLYVELADVKKQILKYESMVKNETQENVYALLLTKEMGLSAKIDALEGLFSMVHSILL